MLDVILSFDGRLPCDCQEVPRKCPE